MISEPIPPWSDVQAAPDKFTAEQRAAAARQENDRLQAANPQLAAAWRLQNRHLMTAPPTVAPKSEAEIKADLAKVEAAADAKRAVQQHHAALQAVDPAAAAHYRLANLAAFGTGLTYGARGVRR
jgi:hypothetical protein